MRAVAGFRVRMRAVVFAVVGTACSSEPGGEGDGAGTTGDDTGGGTPTSTGGADPDSADTTGSGSGAHATTMSDEAGSEDDADSDTGGPSACAFVNEELAYDWAGIYPLAAEPFGVDVGDLDEDGFADLAVATYDAQAVDVLLSAGDWHRPARTTLPVGLYPSTVRVVDLDADGHLDVITNGINVFLGDGTGGFDHLGEFDADSGGLAYEMAVLDLDADGDLDVATANLQGQSVSVLHNDGTGALTLVETVSTWQAWSIDGGDVDGDGDLDLVVGVGDPNGSADIKLLRNDGDGTFAPYEQFGAAITVDQVRLADLDGDGDPDVVGCCGVDAPLYWIENDGDGGFSIEHEIPVEGYAPRGIRAVDLDRDGDTDLVTVGYDAAIVYENDGSGAFTSTRGHIGREVERVALGDIDGDGLLDLATLGEESTVAIAMLGRGIGAPIAPSRWASGGTASSVALGDFDGDGASDLAVSVVGGGAVLEVARGVLAGETMLEDVGPNEDGFDVAVGDFDGDGLLDPVTLGDDMKVHVFRHQPDGMLQPTTSDFGFGMASALAVGRLGDDRDVDVVVLSYGLARVGLGTGTGELVVGDSVSVPTSYGRDPILVDLDDDARPELAIAHYDPAGLTVFAGLPDGTFGAGAFLPLPGSPLSLAAGDADGDADPDLWVVFGDAAVVLNDGGDLSLGPTIVLPTPGAYAAAADLDGDGDAEAVVSSPSHDRLYLLDLQAGGVVLAREHGALDPRSVSIADVDGDCQPEIAIAGGASESAAVLRAL